MQLFQTDLQLSTSEMVVLAEQITHPMVQKYLKFLAHQSIEAIVHGTAKDNESAESYLRRQAVVQGQLAAIETLLMIEAPAKQA